MKAKKTTYKSSRSTAARGSKWVGTTAVSHINPEAVDARTYKKALKRISERENKAGFYQWKSRAKVFKMPPAYDGFKEDDRVDRVRAAIRRRQVLARMAMIKPTVRGQLTLGGGQPRLFPVRG